MDTKLARTKFIILAFQGILIGVLSGLVSVLFNSILSSLLAYSKSLSEISPLSLLWLPIIAGIVVGLIRQYVLDSSNQGFSVSQVMLDLDQIKTLIMNPKSVIIKILGTFITLGSGFSAGRQGPIVHIGGAIGANIAYGLKKDATDTKILIGCGVAGCLAGVFNAPIFATIFVVEILFNRKHLVYVTLILLSSVSSVILRTYAIQSEPFVNLNLNFVFSNSDVGFFILMGIIAGLFAIVYTFLLLRVKKLFDKINLVFIRTAIGGLLVGLTLYLLPNLYNKDYESIEHMLTSDFSFYLLIGILIFKLLLTGISIGSGGLGGTFNPGVYLGALLGLIYGKTLLYFGLGMTTPQTYAILGMAAMFSGFAHAPLTGTIMVIELTGHYEMIFPVVIATLASSIISEVVQRESLYGYELIQLKKNYGKPLCPPTED